MSGVKGDRCVRGLKQKRRSHELPRTKAIEQERSDAQLSKRFRTSAEGTRCESLRLCALMHPSSAPLLRRSFLCLRTPSQTRRTHARRRRIMSIVVRCIFAALRPPASPFCLALPPLRVWRGVPCAPAEPPPQAASWPPGHSPKASSATIRRTTHKADRQGKGIRMRQRRTNRCAMQRCSWLDPCCRAASACGVGPLVLFVRRPLTPHVCWPWSRVRA
jgi:hypothetical protein